MTKAAMTDVVKSPPGAVVPGILVPGTPFLRYPLARA
jgi:hypothetical protein